ncbi:uncharacterized protein FMAN_09934 [Fusarium mangiferae]|uniref:Uncharacterized protein n=1 Tax=Fusarium mangiferae TaxID=192010 RepID=A0A1L7TYQ0_FUSMA|nr:uncharacterized protein FMAN_09934 [Fusarium mangiferae]CVL00517.1 uncharacterized protein FMAN_09934 [Fusarium mangiferae]
MASSSRNSALMRQPLAANHSFQPDVLSQVDQTENELRKVIGGIAALRDGAPPGKDKATMAGYDPQKLRKTTALLKETDIARNEANGPKGDIALTKKSIIASQSKPLTGIDLKDKEARKRASDRVVNYVAGSAENTRLFYSGWGVQVTPATNATAQTALRELAVSNADPPAQGSDPAKQLASLKKALSDNRSLTTRYNEERDEFKKAWEKSKKQIEKLTKTSEQQSRDLYRAKKDLEKATRDYPQLERDLARRNESSLKAQVYKAEAKAVEAESRAKTAEDEKVGLEMKISELSGTVRRYESLHSNQTTQISSLSRQYEHRGKQITALKNSSEKANALVQQLQSELETSRDDHLNKLRSLQTEKNEADRGFQQVSDELGKLQIARSSDSKSLISANEELSRVKGQCEALQLTVEEQQRDLETKHQRISELEQASEEKDASIKVRDETINSQIQRASTFLRYLSLNVESDAWNCIAERVLVDSTSISLTSAEWQPWVVFSSWSGDVSLATRQDTRNLESVALDLLVTLKDKSADAKDLLAFLCQLQKAMLDSDSMLSAVAQLLLEAFGAAIGDPRLHLIQRLVMCQIANLLGPTAKVQQFMQALDGADPRIQRVVHALQAYRLDNSILPMDEAVTYPGVALVGFNRDPQGVIAVSPSDNGICWVDSTNIRTEFTVLKLVSGKGASIEVPLDTTERFDWAMAHA